MVGNLGQKWLQRCKEKQWLRLHYAYKKQASNQHWKTQTYDPKSGQNPCPLWVTRQTRCVKPRATQATSSA